MVDRRIPRCIKYISIIKQKATLSQCKLSNTGKKQGLEEVEVRGGEGNENYYVYRVQGNYIKFVLTGFSV